MPDFPDTSFDQLPLPAKRRIDAICARFERAWQQGRPRLEEFLANIPDSDRPVLLAELLFLDIEYRRRAGESPRPDDYLPRFPDQEPLLRLLFPAAKTDTAGENDPARVTSSHGPLVTRPPPAVPGYEMLGELGRGGMGVVYKARHLALNRLVALKFILAGTNAPARHRVRFRREAEVVARLRHPNVVQIYDIGEVDGQYYLALEYADGGSVRERLAGQPLEPRNAARLLEPLARAVQHAHRQGIVHRDLKPANILLSVGGDSVALGNRPLPDFVPFGLDVTNEPAALPPLSACTPKLTDFGLARMLDHVGPLSELGVAAGTPQYMAPEQAAGEPDAGPAVDVWAMGATLYELLTGRPPFRAATARETLRLILEADPVPPTQLQPSVPRDLETICLKCLEKEPARRYPGARELAQDLQRFNDGEAIHARPDGRLVRLARWARRRPWQAALAVLALAVVATVVGFSAGGIVHALRGWRDAVLGEREAREWGNEQQDKANLADVARGRADEARRTVEEQAAWLLLRQAQDYGARGEPDRAVQDLLAGLRLVRAQGPLDRVFRANLAGWLPHVHALKEVIPVPSEVLGVAGGEGGRVVVACRDGTVRLFDREGKALGQPWKLTPPIRFLSVSEDGRRALVGAGDQVVLRDLDAPEGQSKTLDHPGAIDGALSPDGKTAYTAGADGVRRWVEDARVEPDLAHTAPVRRLALSPDGRALAVALEIGEVWLWDLAAAPPKHRAWPQPRPVTALAFHPDGVRLWAGDVGGRVRLLDAKTGAEVGRPIDHTAAVTDIGVTPDGQRLLSVTAAGVARLWDVVGRNPIGTFRGAPARLTADGAQLVVAHTGEVRVHAVARPLSRLAAEAWSEAGGRGGVTSVVVYPEGNRLLLGETVALRAHGLAWPRDIKPAQSLPAPWRHRLPNVPLVALSPDGKVAATVCRQGANSAVQTWDTGTGKLLHGPFDLLAGVTALAFAPDGREFAAGDGKGSVRFWDAATGRPSGTTEAGSPVRALAYSPDGGTVAVGLASGEDGVVQFLDRKSGRSAQPPLPHGASVTALAFDPTGERLLVGGRVTTLYHLAANRALTVPVRNATVSKLLRQGRVVVVGTASGEIRRFQASDGAELPAVVAPPGPVVAVDLSPDGETLLAASGDGTACLWDVAGRPGLLGPAVVAGGSIAEARFYGEERSVFTLTQDASLRAWPVPRPLGGPLERIERLVAGRDGSDAESISASDWHDARAQDAWQAGDLFAARWHLDRLVREKAADRSVLRRRAVVLARLGLAALALDDHQSAARREPEAFARELEYGLSRCQVAGDVTASRWYVEQLLLARPGERWVQDERALLEANRR